MSYENGERVHADIGRWLLDKGLRQQPEPLKLPGKVVKVASTPDWTYSVLLDDAPVILPGGERLTVVEGLREDQLTAEP